MRIIILFIFIALLDLYAFQAFQHVTSTTPDTVRIFIYALYWMIPVVLMAFLFALIQGATKKWPQSSIVIPGSVFFMLYLSKFLVSAVLLTDDVRRAIVWTLQQFIQDNHYDSGRSELFSGLALSFGVIPILLMSYGMIRNPHRYKVHTKKLTFQNLPHGLEGLKMIHISDIHAGSFLSTDKVARSVELINAEQPDIVFFTGDLVNSSADEMDRFIGIFSKIRSQYGVYSVLGNHDYGDYKAWDSPKAKVENFRKICQVHEDLGWKLLRNAHVVLNINGSQLGVVGVENYSAHPRFHQYGDLGKALEGMPHTDLNILLSHDPSHWDHEVKTKYPQIALTLSGHTHGFQFGIEVPGLLRWSPAQYVYRKWAGLYQEKDQFLYVNRGLGFLGYPGRIGILPEITSLAIKTA